MLFDGRFDRTLQPRFIDSASKVIEIGPCSPSQDGQDFTNILSCLNQMAEVRGKHANTSREDNGPAKPTVKSRRLTSALGCRSPGTSPVESSPATRRKRGRNRQASKRDSSRLVPANYSWIRTYEANLHLWNVDERIPLTFPAPGTQTNWTWKLAV